MKNIKRVDDAPGWFEILDAHRILHSGGEGPVWEQILLSDDDASKLENIIEESSDEDKVEFTYAEANPYIRSEVFAESEASPKFQIITTVSKANDSGRCSIQGKGEFVNELLQIPEYNGKQDKNEDGLITGSIDKVDLNEIKKLVLKD